MHVVLPVRVGLPCSGWTSLAGKPCAEEGRDPVAAAVGQAAGHAAVCTPAHVAGSSCSSSSEGRAEGRPRTECGAAAAGGGSAAAGQAGREGAAAAGSFAGGEWNGTAKAARRPVHLMAGQRAAGCIVVLVMEQGVHGNQVAAWVRVPGWVAGSGLKAAVMQSLKPAHVCLCKAPHGPGDTWWLQHFVTVALPARTAWECK